MSGNEHATDLERLAEKNALLEKELAQLREYSAEQDESVEVYQLLTRNVADLLAIIDVNGRRIWNNRSYRNTLGYSPDELADTNSFNEVHPDDQDLVQKAFLESIETGVGNTIHYRMKHKDGRWIPLESKAQAVRGGDGKVRAVVVVARDMTQRLRLEEEQEQIHKMQALADFSGKVAHSFDEFFSQIVYKVSLVRKSLPEKSAESLLLSDVLKEAEKSQKQCREMLALSGGEDESYQEVDCRKMVMQCIAASVPKGKGIKLQQQITNLPLLISVSIETLPVAIAEVFKNAVESMPKGGVLQVTLTVERREGVATRLPSGNYMVLKIRDQGVGIPAHLKNRIFEPYYSTKEGHQGLGLSTALTVLTEHKGGIFVESKERIGTEVSIYLPVFAPAVEDIGSNSTTITFVKPKVAPAPVRYNRRVLVMDDEALVRDASMAMFKRLGCDVTAVESVEALMEEFRDAQRSRNSYQLIVTDMVVPGAEGAEEVAARIKTISPFTKVIAVSGYSDHPVLLEPEKYGFHAALAKPYELNQIQKILNLLFPQVS